MKSKSCSTEKPYFTIMVQGISCTNSCSVGQLGKDPTTKSDEFLEKFQTAYDPPSFLENYVADFFIMDMLAFMQGGIGQIVSVDIS